MYLFYGKEFLLINREIDKIKKEEHLDDVDISKYNLELDSLKDVIDDAQTVSFFHDKKAILLENCSFLTGNTKKNTIEQPIELLEAYLEHPNPSTIMIFVVPNEKMDERKKIVKLLKKKATVKECNGIQNMNHYLNQLFDGYVISTPDMLFFKERVGSDIAMLAQEAEKLKMATIDTKKIDRDCILSITTKTIDLDIFALIEAIVSKEKAKALEMFDEMVKHGEEPIMIIIMLANQFRIIYQAKELYQKGYTEKDIASTLSIHPFRIKKALEKGRMFESEMILTYLNQLADLDYQIKSGQMDKKLGLELFFLGL
ncbi:MAG: DNA polymerase III subunit delta [Firmicutes bacterium]|nr:DNA polymerase III subunit delta [Bacillota bacterium]